MFSNLSELNGRLKEHWRQRIQYLLRQVALVDERLIEVGVVQTLRQQCTVGVNTSQSHSKQCSAGANTMQSPCISVASVERARCAVCFVLLAKSVQ